MVYYIIVYYPWARAVLVAAALAAAAALAGRGAGARAKPGLKKGRAQVRPVEPCHPSRIILCCITQLTTITH